MPEFIIRESVISYQFAREIDVTELARLITPGSPIPKGFCSSEILSRVQLGGLISKRLKNNYKTALKAFLGIP